MENRLAPPFLFGKGRLLKIHQQQRRRLFIKPLYSIKYNHFPDAIIISIVVEGDPTTSEEALLSRPIVRELINWKFRMQNYI